MDHQLENPLDGAFTLDRIHCGIDAAVGWGGFSLTAAYRGMSLEADAVSLDGFSDLIQVGFLFPDTAWEVAARASATVSYCGRPRWLWPPLPGVTPAPIAVP